ncbi:MAG: TetR/AcrR family transcriptional regulator [Turicibacter sp.]|nr:TetR/AcrR family transcriptional regulator [Turicibacter sp.]
MNEKKREQTKAIIKECFAQLVIDKGFDSVTVSDIARATKFNRGTFYLHYLDKFDLLEKLEDDLLKGFKEKFEAGVGKTYGLCLMHPDTIVSAMNFALKNNLFIKALISENGPLGFIEKFKLMLREHLRTQRAYLTTLSRRFGNVPKEYAEEILLARVTSILALWMKKDVSEKEEPRTIADMIVRFATDPIRA